MNRICNLFGITYPIIQGGMVWCSDKVKELTNGKDIVKVIVVPKKLVNIVVKG